MVALSVLVLACALPAFAQGSLSAEDRSFLERLALAKARSDLLTQVYALPLADTLTVGAWAARDLSRDRTLRLWIRSQPRWQAARIYSDRTCDVDVCLTATALGDQMEQLRQAPDDDQPLNAVDLRRAAQKWPTVWGTGMAALAEGPRSHKPPGWEDVTQEGIEVARRAAEADARHALLDRAGEMPVTNARQLREFLTSSDDVRTAVLKAFERSAEVHAEFELDQVAVAEARIGIIQLIRILTDVHREYYRGELFHAADFRDMALHTSGEFISATGLAVPPSHMVLQARYQPIELDAPEWATTSLAAVGHYEPDDEIPLAADAKPEAARLDGIDRLRQLVEALVIQKDVTVEQFLGYHDELKDDVIIFLSGTRTAGPPRKLEDGGVAMPVELSLRRLWLIVRRGMRAVEVDVPEEAAQPAGGKEKP